MPIFAILEGFLYVFLTRRNGLLAASRCLNVHGCSRPPPYRLIVFAEQTEYIIIHIPACSANGCEHNKYLCRTTNMHTFSIKRERDQFFHFSECAPTQGVLQRVHENTPLHVAMKAHVCCKATLVISAPCESGRVA